MINNIIKYLFRRYPLCFGKALSWLCNLFDKINYYCASNYSDQALDSSKIHCLDVSGGKVVYDIGMFNGDDTEFYLSCGYRVVAIEANKNMCDMAALKFTEYISRGDLHIINGAVADSSSGSVMFQLCINDPVVSRVGGELLPESELVEVPLVTLDDIKKKYGDPYYVKIDIEGNDVHALSQMQKASIIPRYISAEIQDMRVFYTMLCMGYRLFKLVDGYTVDKVYGNTIIHDAFGKKSRYQFKYHSTGPFGEDVNGTWVDALTMHKHLTRLGCGWRDLHAKL